MDIDNKGNEDVKIVSKMINIYCKGNHNQKNGLCNACQGLLDYSIERIINCPMVDTKTFCSVCKVHCYSFKEREQIRQVMRYSGPRMLIYSPHLAIKHAIQTIKAKRGKD
jgi:hypothetical protein